MCYGLGNARTAVQFGFFRFKITHTENKGEHSMKTARIISLAAAAVMLLSACGSKPKAKLTSVAFSADLTHDGTKERIVSTVDGASSGDAGVGIYMLNDDKYNLIWKETIGTKESDQKGIYICKKSGQFDLLVWKPSYSDGKTTLEYSVFYLQYSQQQGKCTPVEEVYDSISFTDAQVEKNGDKYDEASKFVKTLNTYISKSIALADTVGGELTYSPSSSERVSKQYFPDWYDKNYTANDDGASSQSSSAS